MNKLKKISIFVSKLSIAVIVIGVIVAGLNLTVPYYLSSRQNLIDITNNFGALINKYDYENIVVDGVLVVKELEVEQSGDYSVCFNYTNEGIKSANYINFESKGVTISVNDSPLYLPYKSGEDIAMDEIMIALVAALSNIPTLNIMGSMLIAFLHVILVISVFMMTAYFILKKRYKYKSLIKYSVVSVLLASFIVGILSLTAVSEKIIIISIFTAIAGAINMLLLLPAYNQIKSEDYM